MSQNKPIPPSNRRTSMDQDVEVALRITEAIMAKATGRVPGIKALATTYVELFTQVHVRVKEYFHPPPA